MSSSDRRIVSPFRKHHQEQKDLGEVETGRRQEEFRIRRGVADYEELHRTQQASKVHLMLRQGLSRLHWQPERGGILRPCMEAKHRWHRECQASWGALREQGSKGGT